MVRENRAWKLELIQTRTWDPNTECFWGLLKSKHWYCRLLNNKAELCEMSKAKIVFSYLALCSSAFCPFLSFSVATVATLGSFFFPKRCYRSKKKKKKRAEDCSESRKFPLDFYHMVTVLLQSAVFIVCCITGGLHNYYFRVFHIIPKTPHYFKLWKTCCTSEVLEHCTDEFSFIKCSFAYDIILWF